MSQTALKSIAKGEQPESTPAQQMAAFRMQIDKIKPELQHVLGPRIRADAFIGAAWAAVLGDPDLLIADRLSFFAALRKCAGDGLVPDGREAVLNVYNTKVPKTDKWIKKVEFVPMFGGMVKKLYESGEVTYVDAAVVYERDLFAFRRGDASAIEHEPYLGAEDPGPIVASYCIVRLKNGETKREVMPLRDINRVREASKSKDKEKSPWNVWPDQMAIKSVIKRIYKQLPKAPALERLIDHDNLLESGGEHGAAITPAGQQQAAPSASTRAINFDPSPTMADIAGSRMPEAREPAYADGDAIEMEQSAGLDAAMNVSNEVEKPEVRADNGAPTVSYAQLMDMINRAQTLDDLAVAGDLIQYLPPDQQQDVSDAYGRRYKQLKRED